MALHPVVPAELTRGPFTLAEARQAGLTRRQLQGASWRRIGSGLYVWAALADNPALLLAAVHRHLPAAAAFSGQTAAWLHGLELPPCDPVEVTIPESCGISARAGMIVRRALLADQDVVERRRMRVTSAVRTLADLSRRLPLVEAVVAVDMALHSEVVDLGQLHAYMAAHRRRKGVAQLRQVIELAEPASESAMETRLRLLLVQAGLPRPEAQVPLHDERGHFLGRPDLYYRLQRLGVEYDGGTHRDSLLEDNRRQNRLLNAGFRLLRFAAADVHRTPDSVVAVVRAALSTLGPGVHPPAGDPAGCD
ncbi:MAG TPA: DUF559 domain-containing protein [Candidatus Dormibacteraeota bacterium]|nr:DUF559 domain-containing protein [Candidatus Dormibacteraeota bacterium]